MFGIKVGKTKVFYGRFVSIVKLEGKLTMNISSTFPAGGSSNCNAERRHLGRRNRRGKLKEAE